jgi:hypothetical protein
MYLIRHLLTLGVLRVTINEGRKSTRGNTLDPNLTMKFESTRNTTRRVRTEDNVREVAVSTDKRSTSIIEVVLETGEIGTSPEIDINLGIEGMIKEEMTVEGMIRGVKKVIAKTKTDNLLEDGILSLKTSRKLKGNNLIVRSMPQKHQVL